MVVGAGPDGGERAGLFNAAGGEQITTTIFTNLDERGAVNAPNLFERGTDQAPEPPMEGNGLVVMYAPNVRAFSSCLNAAIGGDAFYVGDGSGGFHRRAAISRRCSTSRSTSPPTGRPSCSCSPGTASVWRR